MGWNRLAFAAAATLACVAASAQSGAFAQSFVRGVYDDLAPGLCLVSYNYEVTNPATGQTARNSSHALGVLVSSDGLIMVRGHMVLDHMTPFNIRVAIPGENGDALLPAQVVRKPPDVNVVFLEIQGDHGPFSYVSFDGGPELQLGESVLLVGKLGETLDNVSAIGFRRVGAILEQPRRTYALDDPLPLGYVGAPVVNGAGQVVGVTGYDLSLGEGGDLHVRSGHPIIYQSNLFQRYIDDPHSEPEDDPLGDSWLGVFTQPLTDNLAEYWDLPPEGGIVISSIVDGSPAAAAGFQRGDVVTHFNGVAVRARQDRDVLGFTGLIRAAPTGPPVPYRLLRNGEVVEGEITLVARPRTHLDAEQFEDAVFGMTLREITTDLRLALNLPQDIQGVIVQNVRPGGWAQLAQIRPGVIVIGFGGHPVTNLSDYRDAVEQVLEERPAEVALFGRVGQVTGFFRIEPRWDQYDEQ